MRVLLASAIGVASAAALILPTGAVAAPAPAATAPAVPVSPAVPGSTQSLPLAPLPPDARSATEPPGTAPQGLGKRAVRPFSLLGVVWDDADAELHGTVQVRTRAAGTARWSGWRHVETHNHEHAADPGTAERDSGKVRGSTAPLWVGKSDGVEVRVQAENGVRAGEPPAPLPTGLRLDLVDPGDDPSDGDAPGGSRADGPPPPVVLTPEEAASSAVNALLGPLGATELAPLSRAETEEEAVVLGGQPNIGPRPRIITRRGWGADERLRERNFVYTKRVKAAFVHHSATGNNYKCSQVPSVLRGIYRYHVKSNGWRDIGYNFAIDKCGTIYEGRAGGVANPVLGAHTLGFNSNTMGIAVLGTYSRSNPSAAAVNGVAALTAWKLGLFGADPRAATYLTSGGNGRFKKGTSVKLNVISGHRDGFNTDCPGGQLYDKLGTVRDGAAQLQGR
ncbi:peptidoglycan recognition protein [Streptomyces spiramyceticus]|uniref:peptidoglycan recognition protein family protein n=1 Tax=Streptomyces spiramyceticus TaxID=299717 RepID=UPI00237AE49B|nr:peptidoglycan recognition protein [Streptomyces spiramyceticus]